MGDPQRLGQRLSDRAILDLVDELHSVACQGLQFCQVSFDRERYTRILEAVARLSATVDRSPFDDVRAEFAGSLWHLTPLSGADAAVIRDDSLLLIRRSDNGLWALPGGGAEVGESVAECARRELLEEVGVGGTITRLLGVYDSRLWRSSTRFHMYHFTFQADIGEQTPKTSSEAVEVAFFREDELPVLSPGHALWVPFLFRQLRGDAPIPWFDPTR